MPTLEEMVGNGNGANVIERITKQEVNLAGLTANVQNLAEDLREANRQTNKSISDMGSRFQADISSFREAVEGSMKSIQNRDMERGRGLLPMVLTLGIGGFSVFATITTIYISAQVAPVMVHLNGQDKAVERLENELRDSRDRGIRNETIVSLMHPKLVFDANQAAQGLTPLMKGITP